jgi:hypothetical protein
MGERDRTACLRRSSRATECDDQNEKSQVLEQWCTFALETLVDTTNLPTRYHAVFCAPAVSMIHSLNHNR